jgi:hypothetical protein
LWLPYGVDLSDRGLDRLARATRDLLNILDAVTKKGAAFNPSATEVLDFSDPRCFGGYLEPSVIRWRRCR